MEEKERYEIHRYTLQGNEKIGFHDYAEHICEHYDFGFEKIEPFNQRIQDLLNQQDKRIKELEEENKFLKKRNEELTIDRHDFCLERNDLFEENQQLKEKYDNLYKCYQKTSQEDLQDKYRLAEENEQLKQQLADKDKQIAELKKQVREKEEEVETKNIINNLYKTTVSLRDNDFKDLVYENNSLKQQLKSQPAEIIDEIKKQMDARKLEYISHLTKKHCYGLRIDRIFEILDEILKEYQK